METRTIKKGWLQEFITFVFFLNNLPNKYNTFSIFNAKKNYKYLYRLVCYFKFIEFKDTRALRVYTVYVINCLITYMIVIRLLFRFRNYKTK